MSENQKSNYVKVRGTDNIILNIIGVICGWLANKLLKLSMKWGTWYTLDMDNDEEYGPEYSIDEVW